MVDKCQAVILTEKLAIHSVIVPAYNTQKTIYRCLDSLLSDALSTIEVIVVNDGSTDGTAQILAEYAARDDRIRILTQENSGVSSARNVVMRAATGNIISFVDSDDFVSPRYFSALEAAFRQSDADVVFFQFARVNNAGSVISQHALPEESADYWECLKALSSADIFGYTWVKAWRRSVLKGVFYNKRITLFEDEVFTVSALKKPVKLFYLREQLYNYVCTDLSTLSRNVQPNYQHFCDLAYCAWKNLLRSNASDTAFLQNKVNHFAQVCKYYGLERVQDSMSFFEL